MSLGGIGALDGCEESGRNLEKQGRRDGIPVGQATPQAFAGIPADRRGPILFGIPFPGRSIFSNRRLYKLPVAVRMLVLISLFCVSVSVLAEEPQKDGPKKPGKPLVLYDGGGSALVSCQIDAIGNVSGCTLKGDAKLDDLVQRMVEQMKAAQYAKFRMLHGKLVLPRSSESQKAHKNSAAPSYPSHRARKRNRAALPVDPSGPGASVSAAE